jgi:membrane protease YdiL (CAAX protease family)
MLSEKPWRGEIVMQFIAFQFLCFFSGMVAIALLHKLGGGGFKEESDFGNILLATLCFQGATWILIPIFLRQHQVRWRDAFGLCGENLKGALAVAAGYVAVILPVAWLLQGASVAVLKKIGWPVEDQAAVLLFAGAKTVWLKIYLGAFAIVIAPVAEEFIFRGVLFPFVKQLGYPKSAWLGVSALFALIHFDAGTFVPLFAFALALTWLYEKTDNLFAPIAAHSLFNAANLVLLCLANEFSRTLPPQQ